MSSFNRQALPSINHTTQHTSTEITEVSADVPHKPDPYLFLSRYGIPTELSIDNNTLIIQSILLDLERIAKTSIIFY